MTAESLPDKTTRKSKISEWRHQEVLDAARIVFARSGYANANVEDIAKEAGIAKGTIYLYFKSKEEIFAAILENGLNELTSSTIKAMSAETTFAAQLTVFLELRAQYLRQHQDFLKIYLAEFGGNTSCSVRISEVKDIHTRRALDFTRECVERAIARGELRDIPIDTAARAIHDVARGFAERHLRGGAALTMEEDLDFTRTFLLRGLKK